MSYHKLEISEGADKRLIQHFISRCPAEVADELLLEFATYEMRQRLTDQRNNGFSGWNTSRCENEALKKRLLKNLEKDDFIDVLNLAAMLLARQRLFCEVQRDGTIK